MRVFKRWQRLWQTVLVTGMTLLLCHGTPAAGETTSASEMNLDTVTGETIRLVDFRGKVVLVNFWATWCPPCLREIPSFVKVQQRYSGRLMVVGIDYMEKPDRKDLASVMRRLEMNYPVVYGDASKIHSFARALGGVQGLPTTVVINRQGERVKTHIGELSEAALIQLVEPLLE
ncbi:MAG: TlpA family protein disulfide reductase [Magnetococcales bacterium]|nr:TlpA family protein disulfide reductase [Magnetococcales bacterium]